MDFNRFLLIKDKSSENVPHLEIKKVVLVHCNIVNNDYQQVSRVLYTFVPNKPFGSLLEIFPTNHFLKAFYSEFQDIEVWFKDQKSHPLEIWIFVFCLGTHEHTWVHMLLKLLKI